MSPVNNYLPSVQETLHQFDELLGTDTKAVDNALQRVKRKVGRHLDSRELAV